MYVVLILLFTKSVMYVMLNINILALSGHRVIKDLDF
jgi:hypothetical protein